MKLYLIEITLVIGGLITIVKNFGTTFLLVLGLLACAGNSIAQKMDQNSMAYINDLKNAGYPELNTLSFSDTKKKYALTALIKMNEDRTLFFAQINPNKVGANIIFKAYQPCVSSDMSKRLQERIIMISGQKIETYYACGTASGESLPNEVYLIKSQAGNDFAKKEFSEMHYVFVHLNGLPVPFLTDGFSQALAELSGKAL